MTKDRRNPTFEALLRENEALRQENVRLRESVAQHQSARLSRAQLLLWAITEALPLGLLVLDNRTDEILFFNEHLCRIWDVEHLLPQMRSGQIKNMEVLRVCLERVENVEEFFSGSRRMHNPDNRTVIDDVVELKNGNVIRRFSCQVRDQDDGYLGRLYLFEDITERRRLEEQFRHAQRMESVGRLAGGVAHDINNLLTVILTNCELLSTSEALTGGDREQLDEVREAARLSALVTRELLAFSRKQLHAPRRLDLNEVLDGIRNILARLLDERIRLEMRLQPELWPVQADPGQLEQVVVNLAVNARDAMPEGGTLVVATRNASLPVGASTRPDALPAGDYIVLSIQDTGVGIPLEDLDRIFEPFFTTKGTERGTGLGLSTVYGIVQQNGGTVEVQSEPGNGTRFEVYLPRQTGCRSAAGDQPRPPAGDAAPRKTVHPHATILLVDDNERVRTTTSIALQSMGFHVLAAGSAEEAVELYEAHRGEIDLVLTDVIMPHRDGLELADDLRQAGLHQPLVFMSGFTEDSTALATKGDALVHKPFKPEDLSRQLLEVLERFSRTSEYGASSEG